MCLKRDKRALVHTPNEQSTCIFIRCSLFLFFLTFSLYIATTIITECANDLHSIMWKSTNDFKWRQQQKVLTMCKERNENNEKRHSNISISTFNSILLFFLRDFSSKKEKEIVFIRNEKKIVAHRHLKSFQQYTATG